MQFRHLAAFSRILLVCAGFACAGYAAQEQNPSQNQRQGSSSSGNVAVPSAKPAPPDANGGTFKSEVNEVIVPVTVTDPKCRLVSDLEQKDFHIFENNKPQAIQFFTREHSQPVVVGFLLDLSTASRIHWKNYQAAGEELVQ